MRELSVAEQRYQAVLAVISVGETVTDVAARFGVSRQSVHNWLAKYEAGGLENLADGSHRPRSCPRQMDASVEVEVEVEGKVERFHRAIRTDRVFAFLPAAQAELDQWVHQYNHQRPHQGMGMATPAERFLTQNPAAVTALRPASGPGRPDPARPDGTWVARRASAVGAVCVNWQQVCLGVAAAGRSIDVWVTDQVLQLYDGDQLLRTEKRRTPGSEVRVKRAQPPKGQAPKVKPSVKDQPK